MLRAALDVLADRGMAGFSIEAVAERAAASKATIYRRWASPGHLLVAAMDWSFRPLPIPSTGRLRGDLIEFASAYAAQLEGRAYPRLLAAFIDAAERDPRLKSLHVELTERRREPLRAVLNRARDRGELPTNVDVELAIDLMAGPFFYRRFIAHRRFAGDFAETVVDRVLRAIGGAGQTARSRYRVRGEASSKEG